MRPIISRLIAGPIAAFVAWLIGLGIEVGTDAETALNEAATLVVLAVVTSLYGLVHRAIDRNVNPVDAADPDKAALSAQAKKLA